MDFVISNKEINGFQREIKANKTINVYYHTNNYVKERELFYDDEEITVLADANIAFIYQVKSKKITKKRIINEIDHLTNGYIILIEKKNKNIYLYNDIFGFYHVFYLKNNSNIVISNRFDELIKKSKKELDYYSFLDVILFNYTLIDRTTLIDVKRIKGGSITKINEKKSFTTEVNYNYADIFNQTQSIKLDEIQLSHYLKNALKNNLASNENNILTMTAGFDSRIILSLLCNQKLIFESITFGQKGNIEIETIKPFIDNYSSHHKLIELDSQYINNIERTLSNYIKYTLDSPISLDLPHYLYIKDCIKPSNFITGFMGGEMLSGQSIGAQITFTEFAGFLLTSKNGHDFEKIVLNNIKILQVINIDFLTTFITDYIYTLNEYFYEAGQKNFLRFLINEKYAKFFGAINKVFKNHSNIVTPFMDKSVLDIILNSNLSFLIKEPFQKKPIVNFKVKSLQARIVSNCCSGLSKTKLDRLYSINDLSNYYRFPQVALGYFKSHYLKSNKKNYPKPLDYDNWYRKKIINDIDNIKNPKIMNLITTNTDTPLKKLYDTSSYPYKKKYANIMSFNLAYNRIIK